MENLGQDGDELLLSRLQDPAQLGQILLSVRVLRDDVQLREPLDNGLVLCMRSWYLLIASASFFCRSLAS